MPPYSYPISKEMKRCTSLGIPALRLEYVECMDLAQKTSTGLKASSLIRPSYSRARLNSSVATSLKPPNALLNSECHAFLFIRALVVLWLYARSAELPGKAIHDDA